MFGSDFTGPESDLCTECTRIVDRLRNGQHKDGNTSSGPSVTRISHSRFWINRKEASLEPCTLCDYIVRLVCDRFRDRVAYGDGEIDGSWEKCKDAQVRWDQYLMGGCFVGVGSLSGRLFSPVLSNINTRLDCFELHMPRIKNSKDLGPKSTSPGRTCLIQEEEGLTRRYHQYQYCLIRRYHQYETPTANDIAASQKELAGLPWGSYNIQDASKEIGQWTNPWVLPVTHVLRADREHGLCLRYKTERPYNDQKLDFDLDLEIDFFVGRPGDWLQRSSDDVIQLWLGQVHDQADSQTSKMTQQEQISVWRSRCARHNLCRRTPSRKAEIPAARILQITKISSVLQVRVVDTADIRRPHPPYVTLSHCWGDEHSICLREGDLEQWRHQVPTAALPPAFQSAIQITNDLGIEYIWIDSLCIVQDSEQDWLVESAKMGQVYAEAELTIADTGFANSSHNAEDVPVFSKDVLELKQGSPPIPWKWTNRNVFKSRVEQSLLLQRAWVLQERVMARRIVHFAENGLRWECREAEWCPDFPLGVPASLSTNTLKSSDTALGVLACILNDETGYRELRSLTSQTDSAVYMWWCVVVEEYSRTDMTFDKDRLVAISGIARSMLGIFDTEYYAGLWGSRIIHELLWKVERQSRRPVQYCPPTWSWASVMKHSKPYLRQFSEHVDSTEQHLAKVIETQVFPLNDDPMGLVPAGIIEVKGPLSVLSWPEIRQGDAALQGHVHFDVPLTEERFELFCLAVLIRKSNAKEQTSEVLEALVLQPGNGADGEYSRIGRLTTDDEKTIATLSQPTQRLEKKRYEAFDERRGVYRISIV